MSRILKIVGKPVAFLIIGIYLFACATWITMERPGNNSMHDAWLPDEKNKLDAIYIGSSVTFSSLIPPIAWEKYGISLGIFGNNSQPLVGVKEFLEYAEKKQPNAVYLIAINGVYDEEGLGVNYIHASTDYFPDSFEKIRLINRLSDSFALSWGIRRQAGQPEAAASEAGKTRASALVPLINKMQMERKPAKFHLQ